MVKLRRNLGETQQEDQHGPDNHRRHGQSNRTGTERTVIGEQGQQRQADGDKKRYFGQRQTRRDKRHLKFTIDLESPVEVERVAMSFSKFEYILQPALDLLSDRAWSS